MTGRPVDDEGSPGQSRRAGEPALDPGSAPKPPLRPVLEVAFRAALASLDPARLVHDALPPLPPKRARVLVVAAGKAAPAMLDGALRRWGDRVAEALVVTVDGASAGPSRAGVTLLRAAHPIPDARSVAAAEEALRRASSLGASDLLLALISGGASALLAAPPAGMPLAEKQAIVAALLEGGASIRDVNLVRRHLSRVKGGRLARAAAPARVLTLVTSDVIHGALADIGSGPTVPDVTTVGDARAVLRRWVPASAETPYLDESLKPDEGLRLRARILASPETLAEAAAAELARAGFRASVEGPDEGDAAAVVERRLARASSLSPGEAVAIACEPTLELPASRGRGGRAGWIALAAMRRLPPGVTLLCAASDGVDGSSGAGGAVVHRADAADTMDHTVDSALSGFDDASVHRALGTHLPGGPTGHNLADLHILARAS